LVVGEGQKERTAICVGVITPDAPINDEAHYLAELRELLATAGTRPVAELLQRRELFHPNLYIGSGKLNELKELLKETGAKLVVCDDELSPRQERNLEEELKVAVIDRTALILDIFAMHAHTLEGKLQTELAQLEYNMARMRGLWTHLERLGGGIGTRGPGESQIETDRRLARNRISELKRRLRGVSNNRSLLRQQRQSSQLPQVALVGYTNAGKSTLLNAICGEEKVSVRNRLFHTLDPTTRLADINGLRCLVTDTVGFIQKLPHKLVEAFGATLEETKLAGLLLHVVDASSGKERIEQMIGAVTDVLQEIEADRIKTLLVLNKIDRLNKDALEELQLSFPHAYFCSAREGDGLPELKAVVKKEIEQAYTPIKLLIPYQDSDRIPQLHDVAAEIRQQSREEGTYIEALVPSAVASRYSKWSYDSAQP